MCWVSSQDSQVGVVLVGSGLPMLSALQRALPFPVDALRVDSSDSVVDVLDRLKSRSGTTRLLCLCNDLRFQEASSSRGAALLCEHVRLTPELGALCLAPIVVVMSGQPQLVLQADVEQLPCFAPGCHPIPVWQLVASLMSLTAAAQRFEDVVALRTAIQPFLIETETARQRAAHDYRNLAGAGRLLQEFAGDVLGPNDDLLAESRRVIAKDIVMKRRRFVDANGPSGFLKPEPLAELRREFASDTVILVDDEHRNGWGLALFGGLFGARPGSTTAVAPGICRLDSKLWCIDSEVAAEGYFRDGAMALTSSLTQWSQKDRDAHDAAVRLIDARQAAETAKKTLGQTETDLRGLRDRLQSESDALRLAAEATEKSTAVLNSLVDWATRTADLNELLTFKGGVAHLSETLDGYQRRVSAVDRSARDYESRAASVERLRRDADEAATTLKAAQQSSQQLSEGLTRARQLPDGPASASLVMLDMRLDRERDRYASPDQTSGARVLQLVKGYWPFLPVMILTASSRAESVAVLSRLGADGYWIKHEGGPEDLVTLLRACHRKARIHRLWVEVRRIAARAELLVHRLNQSGGFEDVLWQAADRQRVELEETLRRVCELLYDASGGPRVGRTGPDSLANQAVRELGRLQEIRYANNVKFADSKWFGGLPQGEKTWRLIRNDVTHDGKHPSLDSAIEFLAFTIDRLLA